MQRKVAIIGAGGFGREVAWLIRDYNEHTNPGIKDYNTLEIIGFTDPDKTLHGKTISDIEIIGSDEILIQNRDIYGVCAIGDPRKRIKTIQFLESQGVKFISVIHPSLQLSEFVEIGTGCVICAGTIITTQVQIGNHVHINLASTIGHDVIIEDFVTIAPGVNISGKVKVEYGAYLGTNCSVIEGRKIGKGTVIGAGAVVNRDVEDNIVSVGVPACSIKRITEMI